MGALGGLFDRRLRSWVIAGAVIVGLGGCAPSYTILREDTGRARWQVTSQPPGALVTAGNVRRGPTPVFVELPTRRVERIRRPGEWKLGWWLLGTGLVAAGAGTGLTVWGANNVGGSPSGDYGPVLAVSLAPLAALYGTIGLVAGIYSVIVHRPRRLIEIEPSVLPLRLERPGVPAAEAQVVLEPRSLGARGRIHFTAAAQGWSASLSDGASLRVVSAPLWPDRPTLAGAPPAPAATATATEPAAALAPDLAILQDLRQQGETCYRRRDYRCAVTKFERALTLAPTTSMRFNLASAQDKLGEAVLAVRQYRRYVEEAGSSLSPTALAHIQRRMKQLLPRVGRLQLTRPSGDIQISVDGIALSALDPTSQGGGKVELALEPGEYRLDVSAPGKPARTIRVELKAGILRTIDLPRE